ncbi:hypothetical protein FMUND_15658 [Fusarium mundagurra]|uniref:F-box domain-containing protein n=1 Tax=Fusarium mundagurra TaxID=1567541 RepID=A0A8H6CY46_9HYPO|nr:hypothetical protein FMUND_15658 [Fusarium mundagurra]
MRNRLVLRLREQGWPDHLARWAESFMEDRSARVRYQDTLTQFAPFQCGLPQGSPASPILFLLYTEPKYQLGNPQGRSGYADDTAILSIGDTVDETTAMASSSIDEMYPTENQMALLALPPELFIELAAFLEAKDLVTFLRTSRQIYPIIEHILYCRDTKSNSSVSLLWAVRKGMITTARKAIGALECERISYDLQYKNRIQLRLNEALRLAASGGHKHIVQLLLNKGAEANGQREGRATALQLALLHRHQEIVDIILVAY